MAKSFTGLKKFFTDLSLNSSTANNTLGGTLINDQHRYTIQKYFDNERSFTMTTIGPSALTLAVTSGTTAIPSGGTNATLSTAWSSSNINCQQLVVFSNGQQRNAFFTQGSTSINWQSPLTSSAGTGASAVGVQFYPLPANVSKVKNGTINVGQLLYTPAPVQSIQEWTKLNALPYNSSIPAYFYVYQNQIGFWPIPSDTGDVITLNCQINVSDMTYEDVSTGTIATAVGSNIVTGTSTSWTTTFPANTDLTFANLYLIPTPPNGDGLAYQIQSFQNGTTATLLKPIVNAPNPASSSYLIGQYPLLSADFHDILVYWALKIYYNSIVKDTEKFQMYDGIFKEKLHQMEAYLSTKQVNVDLSETPVLTNPNLYINSQS